MQHHRQLSPVQSHMHAYYWYGYTTSTEQNVAMNTAFCKSIMLAQCASLITCQFQAYRIGSVS